MRLEVGGPELVASDDLPYIACAAGGLTLYDAATQRALASRPLPGGEPQLGFVNGKLLAIVAGETQTRLTSFALPSLEPVAELELAERLRVVAFLPSRVLVTNDSLEQPRILAVTTRLYLDPIAIREPLLLGTAAPEERLLVASRGRDAQLECWDPLVRRALFRLNLPLMPRATRMGFSSRRRILWIASSTAQGALEVYRYSDGRLQARIDLEAPIVGATGHPESPRLVVATRAGDGEPVQLIELDFARGEQHALDVPAAPRALCVVEQTSPTLVLHDGGSAPVWLPLARLAGAEGMRSGAAAAATTATGGGGAAASGPQDWRSRLHSHRAAATPAEPAATAPSSPFAAAAATRMAPSARTTPATADGRTASTAADGRTASTAADGRTASTAADSRTASPAADGRTAAPAADAGTTSPAGPRVMPPDAAAPPTPADADARTTPPADAHRAQPADVRTAPPADARRAQPADVRTAPSAAARPTPPAAARATMPAAARATTPADAPLDDEDAAADDDADAGSWRDQLCGWAERSLIRPRAAPSLPDLSNTPVAAAARRMELDGDGVYVLALLYGARLLGHDGVAAATVARLLADGTPNDAAWDEALGRGALAELRLAWARGGRLRLTSAAARFLDGTPPRLMLVHSSGAHRPLPPGPVRLASEAPLKPVGAQLAARFGCDVALLPLDGDRPRQTLRSHLCEARLHGAWPVIDTAADPAHWIDALDRGPSLLLVRGELPAVLAAVPPL